MRSHSVPIRQVRAVFDSNTIRVYQAYRDEIADAALAAGTFVPPFSVSRMTWIKPSFLWMMYRCGWAAKDAGQARVLAIDISREGFEWALRNSCLSDVGARVGVAEARRLMRAKPVRVQWDPERNLNLAPLDHRSIQIGLSGEASRRYVENWIVNLTEVTDLAHAVEAAVRERNLKLAAELVPEERPYPLSQDVAEIVEASPVGEFR